MKPVACVGKHVRVRQYVQTNLGAAQLSTVRDTFRPKVLRRYIDIGGRSLCSLARGESDWLFAPTWDPFYREQIDTPWFIFGA